MIRLPSMVALWLGLALGGCPTGHRAPQNQSTVTRPAGAASSQRKPPCVAADYLPSWACLPKRHKTLREFRTTGVKATVEVSGRRVRIEGEVLQQTPIAWASGSNTRVDVVAETHQQWIRGDVLASNLRFVLKKGTRLYSGPKGAQVGLLTADLEVTPHASQNHRVSFEYATPTRSNSPALILWAAKAGFRHDSKAAGVPAQWSGTTGTSLPPSLTRRLNHQFTLFVENQALGMIPITWCDNLPHKLRLLEKRAEKIEVTIRLVDGYSQKLGPVLLRGWVYLAPKPKRSWGRAPKRPKFFCAFLARAARRFWQYDGGQSVTARPLPLYLSPDPNRAPVGVLSQNVSVTVNPTTLVSRGRTRFLKVHRSTVFYVPYHPRLFRKAPK